MRLVIQRVTQAEINIDGAMHASIANGLLILLGISTDDNTEDADKLSKKVTALRIFSDENGQMNRSVTDIKGEILIVSQFTLYGDASKGNRPSFIHAARPEQAIPLYEYFVQKVREGCDLPVKTGVFGADMKIHLVNDGPVTIIMDSKK
ncbi:MAG: D-tyrosyl-tRNA(Tyr) deacylase [Bacteroidetes bacterium]|jgi:D-tyrosyl-tRNA(Tyr) deacylase|nr:D-tyrosyl-tRNA(Tyr) deacylase [Bacteroidota bacterium]